MPINTSGVSYEASSDAYRRVVGFTILSILTPRKDEGFAGTTRINCLVKEQKKEYQTGWKIKMGNVLDSCNQRSTQQFWSVQGSLGRGYNHVYISSEQGHHHQRLKTPIDMLGFFGWLASIKHGMLEPVKVKCIFLGYRKGIVGNKLWRLDDVTSKVVLYRNMGFNESGKYKKTFIGSGVGTGSMQVLQGDEFEVEPEDGHTFEVEPHGNVNHVVGSQEVQTQDLIYYHPARDREQHSKAGLKDDMDARSDVYVLSNGCKKCSDDSDGYYWESTPGMFIHLFLYIDGMVFSCGCKAEIGSAKSLLKKEFDMKELGEAKKILGMEIVRDRSRFVDSDYAKDPDKGRSITGYAFLVQGCVVSWKATLQHVVALSTTEAEYMALTEAVKEAIWLRGLLEELGVELNTMTVNCDNHGAIHLSRNHVFHERTKHINVRYHFIREVLEAKTVKVLKVGTEHNAADALTKVVPGRKLQHCLELLKEQE
ncbi:zinc finger, CCHC-type containing protein, partial [Tanacetum coccineum]